MALDPPRTLTPSKVTAFTNCPLAFRFSQIERLPEPPSPPAVKGTLVHAALERLFWHHPPGDRTPAAAAAELERAWDDLQDDEEFVQLALDAEAADAFLADARPLVENYFRLEDPNERTDAVGVELGVETMVDGHAPARHHRPARRPPDGRLDRRRLQDGPRAVASASSGAAWAASRPTRSLCESMLGQAPAEVRLLYLRQPVAISSVPSEQTIRGQRKRAVAVWTAIERACDSEDFRPNVGPLCDYCHFKSVLPRFRRRLRCPK